MELDYQQIESVEADFEKMTWTFQIQPHNRVTGGHFCVVETRAFTKAMAKLSYADQLLQELLEGKDIRQGAMKFFDPDPL